MANNVNGSLVDDTIDSLRESNELAGCSKDVPIRCERASAEEVLECCNRSINWNSSGGLSTGLIIDDCECDLVRALAGHETTWQGDHGGGEESERGHDGEDHFEFEDGIKGCFLLYIVDCLWLLCSGMMIFNGTWEIRGSLYLFIVGELIQSNVGNTTPTIS